MTVSAVRWPKPSLHYTILQRVAVGSEEQNVEAHTANLWSKNNLWITSPIDTF